MSRRFRLATVERLRSAAALDATAELGRARRALEHAEDEAVRLRQAVLTCVPAARATPDEVQGVALQRQALRDAVEAADTRIAARRAELAGATENWHLRRSELRAVENLRVRHQASLAEADARQEQRAADEAALVAAARGGHDQHGPAGGAG